MKLKIALPKGRLLKSTKELLEKSGIFLNGSERNYKPDSNLKNIQFYIIKPRNIPKLVEQGLFDAGIVGLDLVKDEESSAISIMDLKLMPVYLMIASPHKTIPKKQTLKIASEYTGITTHYFKKKNQKIEILKTYGSTECFVPEFADIIVDHTQSGSTLKQNNLTVHDVILKSTTHLFVTPNLSKQKLNEIKKLKPLFSKGLKQIDLSYSEFLTEDQIRTNNF